MNFIKKYRFHLTAGAIAGAVNGFLGAGGGIIITYFLSHALSKEQKEQNGVFANAVATMLPISIVSLVLYLRKGYLRFDKKTTLLLPCAIIGGLIGSFLLSKLKLHTVKLIFAFLVTISGIMMIFR